MVKTLHVNSTQEPEKRSLKWLKLKKDQLDKQGDSIDTVVVGAWWGRGKRKGVLGAFLLTSQVNDGDGEFQTLCKIGTGLTDDQLKNFTEKLSEIVVEKKDPRIKVQENNKSELLQPDVWLEIKYVWEVKAADLSLSPVHSCALGLVNEARGISLRFPRFIRERDDKTPENATTSEQVVEMYKAQANKEDDGDEFD